VVEGELLGSVLGTLEGLALGASVGVNVGEAVSMQTATILKSVTPIPGPNATVNDPPWYQLAGTTTRTLFSVALSLETVTRISVVSSFPSRSASFSA
jgi:hypothetical protein